MRYNKRHTQQQQNMTKATKTVLDWCNDKKKNDKKKKEKNCNGSDKEREA